MTAITDSVVFSDYICAADPHDDLPFRLLCFSKRGEHMVGFFRMIVKLVKLKETGLESVTELSCYKYIYLYRISISQYFILFNLTIQLFHI